MEERLDFAIKLVRKVGNILMGSWGNPDRRGIKSGFQDLITDMDMASQEIIVEAIKERFPDDGILSEEGVNDRKSRMWIIDPIDGTVNYAYGLPSFSVSVAYSVDGDVKVGVVHLPKMNETYYAVKGHGAFMNGERISVSERKNLQETVGLLGFSRGFTSKLFDILDDKVVRLRVLGSIAVAGVYVAAGKADFAIAKRANPWDIAAAHLILREAGGVASDLSGSPIGISSERGFVFASRSIHDILLKEIKALRDL